jgi:predicted AlkP superfamily phosphohydrolase/phosphomutase
MTAGSSTGKRRVLLIGLDSADAGLIETWMGGGHMPNFSRLKSQGCWHRAGTTAEIMHVSAWPTLYTGTTPGHHGLYHAYQVRAGRQTISRAEPWRSPQPPFWKHLDDAGRKCIVFDAFMDYKLPDFHGIQVLDYGTWTWFGEPQSTPSRLLGEIRRRFGRYPAPEHNVQVRVPDDLGHFRDLLIAGARVKSRIVQALMKEQDWDLLFATFGEPHGAGHYLWHIGDRDYPLHPEAAGKDTHPLRDVYGAVDEAIGAIADAADDRTTVMIVSGDGMGPNYSGCHLMPELLHRMDLFHSGSVGQDTDAKPVRKAGLLSQLRQAVPMGLRQSVSRCMPRSMRYRLSLKWMNSGTDWERSRVFCIPNSNEGYFRVNLRGREPLGIVEEGQEYADILGRLRETLAALTNPANRQQAAERVSLTDEVFAGACRADLPDAMISWDVDARISTELHAPEIGTVKSAAPGFGISPFYTGNHRPTAFVLVRGPGIAAGASLADPHILDVAPTVLALLGVEPPRNYEGRPWW